VAFALGLCPEGLHQVDKLILRRETILFEQILGESGAFWVLETWQETRDENENSKKKKEKTQTDHNKGEGFAYILTEQQRWFCFHVFQTN
jgi:hypothetical protein